MATNKQCLEATIVKNIITYLRKQQGCFCWKEHGGMYGTAGIPDIIACYKGRFLAFEVKRPGNKPTLLQDKTIKDIAAVGGSVFVVHSLDEAKMIMGAYINLKEDA